MKKVLFIALLFIGFNAFSQQGMPSPEQMAKGFAAKMTETLGLTEDQGNKISTYVLENITKNMEKAQQTKTPPTVEEATKQLEAQKAFFKETVNEEQFKKYSEEIYPMMLDRMKKQLGKQ